MKTKFAAAATSLIDLYLRQGLDLAEAKKIVERSFDEIERSRVAPLIIFTECNQSQIRQISEILEESLKLAVSPMRLDDLEKELPALIDNGRKINIVTTGFHVNEVRNAVGEMPIQIDILITNLNPEIRRQLENRRQKRKIQFYLPR